MAFTIRQRQEFQQADGVLGQWDILGRTITVRMRCQRHAPGDDVRLTEQGIVAKRATITMIPAWTSLSEWERIEFERQAWQDVRTKILDIRQMMLTMPWEQRKRGVLCQH